MEWGHNGTPVLALFPGAALPVFSGICFHKKSEILIKPTIYDFSSLFRLVEYCPNIHS